MTDRTELLEAALDSYPEGIALLGLEGRMVFWNRAAESITGYAGADLLARPTPGALEELLRPAEQDRDAAEHPEPPPGRGLVVHTQHKLGHNVPAIARTLVLRDGLGERLGTAVIFHPAESLNALPRGETDEGSDVAASQTELEDRLETEYEDFRREGTPFGVLWITVDQAHELRKTHGVRACEAMLEKVERTLANGLRPGEGMGRWGDDEFLVLSHERTVGMLAAHAQVLAGLARTTEFRWWGDRVSLTVSIGAAQADLAEAPSQLLERAQSAMLSSLHAGGNHITQAPGRQACSPS
jgi:diguanylate cyclase (GGDEF)-like protein/PAS domain S-box-containing protein